MAKILENCSGFVMIRDSDNPFSLFISYPIYLTNSRKVKKMHTDLQSYRPDPRNYLDIGTKYCATFEFGLLDTLVNDCEFPILKSIHVKINGKIKSFKKVR